MKQTLNFILPRLGIFIFFFAFVSMSLGAQTPQDTLDTSSPGGYLSEGNVGLLQGALAMIISYLATFIPGVSKVSGYLRTVVVVLLLAGVFWIYKKDALNIGTFQFIFDNFGQLLFGAIGSWESLKWVFQLFGINIKPKVPTTVQP